MQNEAMPVPHNLYFHVPFCVSKCNYCAFYSTAAQPDWKEYEERIIHGIKHWSGRLGRATVPTIFFGGGTPSLMPAETFARIMDAARENFDIAPDAEITLEANPGTLDSPRLREFIAAGVNRLSVGAQSFDDDALKFLGRRHTAADARKLLGTAQDAGLRVSGDFIYGLPGQTISDIEKMCRGILDLGLRHASLYELSIEPGTPFAKQNLSMPTNEAVAEMYQAIGDILADALPRYEVSNHAAPGEECRHNLNVWDGQPYIGIGPAACGRILIDGRWWEQESNVQCAKCNVQIMDSETRAKEKIITGLRTMRGVALTPDVRDVIDWNFAENHPDYLQAADGRMTATPKGILILDSLLPVLLV